MDITKLLLVGGAVVGGYLLTKKQTAPDGSPLADDRSILDKLIGTGSRATVTDTAAGYKPADHAPAPAVLSTTQSMVLAAAGKADPPFTQGSVDQWNYFYAQARGVPAPGPDTWGITDADRSKILTFDEWWTIGSSHGLSGIRRTGGPMIPNQGVGYIRANRLMAMEME